MADVTLITVETEVSKEHLELAEAFATMYGVAKKQLHNGFQPLEDISAIVLESYKKLYDAVIGFEQLAPAAQKHPGAVLKAWAIAAGDVIDGPKQGA